MRFAEADQSGTAEIRERVPFGRKIAYSGGQLIELVIVSTLNIFALFYVTAVCGMPGWLAGLALGAGLVVDAVTDPLIGSLSDGWRSRWGRRVPFMVASLFPMLVTYNLIFALPANLSMPMLFMWLTLLSVSLRISISLFALPYRAVGVELTEDYSERSSIAAWRWGIGILGTFAVIALGYGVFLAGPGGVSRREGYLPLTLTLSVILLIGALAAIYVAAAIRKQEHEPTPHPHGLYRRLTGEMNELFRNPTFRLLFFSALLLNIGQGVSAALSLHLGMFFWKLDSQQMPALAMATIAGMILAAPLAGPLASRMEKRTILVASTFGLAMMQTLPVVLKVGGFLPAEGAALLTILALMTFLNGMLFALSNIGIIAIIPDAADEHEHLFGTRREALYFAGEAFATKAASGAGLLIAGIGLQLIGFPETVSEQVAASLTVPHDTLVWLGTFSGPCVSVLTVISAVILLPYRIDKAAHRRIIADLAARRAT